VGVSLSTLASTVSPFLKVITSWENNFRKEKTSRVIKNPFIAGACAEKVRNRMGQLE
jgi:hypothetical protein